MKSTSDLVSKRLMWCAPLCWITKTFFNSNEQKTTQIWLNHGPNQNGWWITHYTFYQWFAIVVQKLDCSCGCSNEIWVLVYATFNCFLMRLSYPKHPDFPLDRKKKDFKRIFCHLIFLHPTVVLGFCKGYNFHGLQNPPEEAFAASDIINILVS